jgi:hypothetical protein
MQYVNASYENICRQGDFENKMQVGRNITKILCYGVKIKRV